jgi:hypothetical protein
MRNLLIIYEIADKAARVTSKAAFREFEKWANQIIGLYKDRGVEQTAKVHLYKLKDMYA